MLATFAEVFSASCVSFAVEGGRLRVLCCVAPEETEARACEQARGEGAALRVLREVSSRSPTQTFDHRLTPAVHLPIPEHQKNCHSRCRLRHKRGRINLPGLESLASRPTLQRLVKCWYNLERYRPRWAVLRRHLRQRQWHLW